MYLRVVVNFLKGQMEKIGVNPTHDRLSIKVNVKRKEASESSLMNSGHKLLEYTSK